jgi:hypothetical protein
MSISNVSASSIAAQQLNATQNPWQQGRQDFASLAAALQSGDLQGAQSAFADLQSILGAQSASSATASTTPAQNSISSDFSALKAALAANDLQSSQSAFQKLMQDLRGHRHGHGHHQAIQAATAPAGSAVAAAGSGLNATA